MGRATVAAYSLHLDLVAVEATRALEAAGIPSIVLKGPSIATWLYADGGARPYDDCDLLVPLGRLADARRVLADLGYTCRYAPLDASGTLPAQADHHAEYWHRADARIDLHWRIPGTAAAAEEAWSLLASRIERLPIANATLPVLDVPARALHVALHAAQHRPSAPVPVRDVERLVVVLPDARWLEVRALAEQLGATGALAVGLERVPAGRAIVVRHGLATDVDEIQVALRAVDAPPATFGLATLRAAGPREVARVFFPPPGMLRDLMPLARRSRRGLAAAYAVRLVDRALHVPAALRALREARRVMTR